jgi:acetylornithine deacetylase/succinyl-diaminopimelate desuccinylase-like protein
MVKAIGKAAHSGYPWLGESANSMLIPALSILETLALPWSKKYGNTTLNIGRMEGGVANNVIAEAATAGIAVRLANGTAEMTKQIILHAIKEVDHRLEVMFLSEGYGPVDVDADVEGSFYILLYQLVQFLSWLWAKTVTALHPPEYVTGRHLNSPAYILVNISCHFQEKPLPLQ